LDQGGSKCRQSSTRQPKSLVEGDVSGGTKPQACPTVRWPRPPMHNTHPTPHVAKRRAAFAWRAARRQAAARSLCSRQRPGTLASKPSLAIFHTLHPKTPAVNGGGSLASRILRNLRVRDGAALFAVHLPPVGHPSIVHYSPFNHTTYSAKSARHG
jgi:hypothetical protein